jgi:hypothetical protein
MSVWPVASHTRTPVGIVIIKVARNRHEPPTWASRERAAIRLGMNCFLEVGYGGCHG